MSNRRHQFLLLAGIVILLLVILVLLTSPNTLFSPVAYIDTERFYSSGNEITVRTKTDFGSQEHMAAFPREIGKWTGHDYRVTKYVEQLGADAMLLRMYEPNTFTQPLFFLILQAKTESSFHPPQVCIRAQGHQIQEEGDVEVVIASATWLKDFTSITIPMKKLVTMRKSKAGDILERRVVLFCYVKGNQFYSDTITMLQMEALIPISGPFDDIVNEEKDFISQAFPYMFEPAEEIQWYPPLMGLVEKGVVGYIAIAVLFLIPVIIIGYSTMRLKKKMTRGSK
jgi:hypothetical protein